MAIRDEIRHQAALAGQVVESHAQKPIPSAQVQVVAAPAGFMAMLALGQKQYGAAWDSLPARPDRALTALDGHFHFLDLPDGDYTIAASLPAGGSRYGTVQGTATVKRDGAGNLKPAILSMAVPSTTVQGKVTKQSGGDPIGMAAIQVQGSGETAYTVADGTFRLLAIEKGSRTINASAPGFQPSSQVVVLANAGDTQVLNFVLTAA
jgi:hypothetical protein